VVRRRRRGRWRRTHPSCGHRHRTGAPCTRSSSTGSWSPTARGQGRTPWSSSYRWHGGRRRPRTCPPPSSNPTASSGWVDRPAPPSPAAGRRRTTAPPPRCRCAACYEPLHAGRHAAGAVKADQNASCTRKLRRHADTNCKRLANKYARLYI
jgi:hypothetical protein